MIIIRGIIIFINLINPNTEDDFMFMKTNTLNCIALGLLRSSVTLLCVYNTVLPLASASNHGSFGGHHNRRYSAYDYDLTTPQFTPDGRLLQVEYATKACLKDDSNPIVSFGVNLPDSSDTMLIMATISEPPPFSTSLSTIEKKQHRRDTMDEKLDQQDEDEYCLPKVMNQRAQFRIIEVPLSVYYSSSLQYQHRTTSTILVGLSGLISDATTLLHTIYSHLEEEQRMFGWHRLGFSPVGIIAVDENNSSTVPKLPSSKRCHPIFTQPSETVFRLTQVISDKCQKHAFGGGLRPLGASLLLAGVDVPNLAMGSNSNRKMHGARMAMCETHPNGGWRKNVYNKRNGVDNAAHQVMVTGGPIYSQHRLKRLIHNRWDQGSDRVANGSIIDNTKPNDDLDKVEAKYLYRILRTVISSLVEEWISRGDRAMSAFLATPGQPSLPMSLPQMEVVISSPKLGTFRLTENDITRLMKTDDV